MGPILILLSMAKMVVAHHRYLEIHDDADSLLELYSEANVIAEEFDSVNQTQRVLIERSAIHYDLDGPTNLGEDGELSSAYVSSHNNLFKVNAVNPPSAIFPGIPNDIHTDLLVSKLDPSSAYMSETVARAQEQLKSLPVLSGVQMTLLTKSQQVEMLQYALRNGGKAGVGGGGTVVNIDTHKLLPPDYDVDSTDEFVISGVTLSFWDGLFSALLSPSIVDVAKPKYAPSWFVYGVMKEVWISV
eukprot:GDKK01018974.1.p1 GENE.GDKK01018974.1~~GDKK01018974.1.p1  ORF type:complete len:244 (+),score=18.72 GDKK01018974.1:1-732(+)